MKIKANRKSGRLELGEYIVADPAICRDKPAYKGTRIMVWNDSSRRWQLVRWPQRIEAAAPQPPGGVILLGENIIHNQCEQLRQWRIPFRQIGVELARAGARYPEIIPLPLRLKKPTLLIRDFDYFRPQMRQSRYRLRHGEFHAHDQLLGKVFRRHVDGLK